MPSGSVTTKATSSRPSITSIRVGRVDRRPEPDRRRRTGCGRGARERVGEVHPDIQHDDDRGHPRGQHDPGRNRGSQSGRGECARQVGQVRHGHEGRRGIHQVCVAARSGSPVPRSAVRWRRRPVSARLMIVVSRLRTAWSPRRRRRRCATDDGEARLQRARSEPIQVKTPARAQASATTSIAARKPMVGGHRGDLGRGLPEVGQAERDQHRGHRRGQRQGRNTLGDNGRDDHHEQGGGLLDQGCPRHCPR